MPLHEGKRNPLARLYLSFLSFSVPALLLAAPWFHGLTRFKDQLATELILFALAVPSVFFIDFGRLMEPAGGRLRSLDGWMTVFLFLAMGYVLFSTLPYRSLLTFSRFFSVVAFYFLVRIFVQNERTLYVLLWTFVIAGAFYSVYGLLQYYDFLPHEYWHRPNGLASRYVNGGHFAVYLLFPIFIGASLIAVQENFFLRSALAAALFLEAWALLLSRSRTGWLVCLLGFGIFLFQLRKMNRIRRNTLWALALLLIAGFFLLWSAGFLAPVFSRIEKIWTAKFYSLIYRGWLWQASLEAMIKRPWGWGLGTYVSILPVFRIHSDRFTVDYAHNEFLQIGVDLGLPGVLLFILFLKFFFGRFLRYLKSRAGRPWEKTITAGLFALGTALFFSSQVDFPLRLFATGLTFAAYLAVSAFMFDRLRGRPRLEANEAQGAFLQNRRRKVFPPLIALVLLIAGGLLTARQLYGQAVFERGIAFEKDFAWQKAVQEYEKAASLTPSLSEYHEKLGGLYRKKAALAMNQSEKKKYRDLAIRALERAAGVQRYGVGRVHYVLAQLYSESGERKQARFHYRLAAEQEPMNALFVSEYGYSALESGDLAAAIGLFEKFQTIRFREGTRKDPCEILRAFYPRTQDYENLRRVVSQSPEDRLCLGYVLGENGQWAKAAEELERVRLKARALYPAEDYMHHFGRVIARFYVKHGRLGEAAALYREGLQIEPGNEEYQRELRVLNETSQALSLRGAEADPSPVIAKPPEAAEAISGLGTGSAISKSEIAAPAKKTAGSQ